MEKDDSEKSTEELLYEYFRLMDLTDRPEYALRRAICSVIVPGTGTL
jgi:hypothetical protein